jgi:hypothetical protein
MKIKDGRIGGRVAGDRMRGGFALADETAVC